MFQKRQKGESVGETGAALVGRLFYMSLTFMTLTNEIEAEDMWSVSVKFLLDPK